MGNDAVMLVRAARLATTLERMAPGLPTPGQLLRACLKARGMTQRQLAAKAGMHQPAVAQIAVGRRVRLEPATAIKLEQGTGIDAEVWMVLAALAVLDAHT